MKKFKKIGLIIADERQAIMEYFQNSPEWEICRLSWDCFEVYWAHKEDINIYILFCGCGEVQAASGVQHLIDKYDVEVILNHGVVGGINPSLKTGDVVIVSDVIPHQYDLSPLGYEKTVLPKDIMKYTNMDIELVLDVRQYLNIPTAICASGDKFLVVEDKKEIWEKYETDICDMESYGIIYTSNVNNIPCILLKSIADDSDAAPEEYRETLYESTLRCLKYIEKLIQ